MLVGMVCAMLGGKEDKKHIGDREGGRGGMHSTVWREWRSSC